MSTTSEPAPPRLGDALKDSVLHALFSPVYVLHRPAGRHDALWPLFGYEASLHTLRSEDDDVRIALSLLDRFGRTLLTELLRSRLADPPPCPGTGWDAVRVDIGSRQRSLSRPRDVEAFCRLGPVDIDVPIRVHRPARTTSVLVLGSYVPYPPHYIEALWAGLGTPMERLRAGERLRPIEATLLLCDTFEREGLYALTCKADRRHIVNVYHRTQSLMTDADVIVLILESGALGTAMELGMICAQPEIARKTVVLARASDPLTGLATFGAFRLNRLAAVSYFSSHEELVARAKVLVPDVLAAA
ncbi:hypothetical protein [Plantactinospora endophytica]|uniref:Uncharacterized protein n=1 Tax=Plantactinospora endophytica TaxID=673535 RepID=A0ABQ4DUZ4_9ACTN|nr:hypothetical protein [Plantactinospora endophytica]GIG86278.1 hypothetical protein Pen02_12140 [Plantactinospora endophytica]